jgi:hypothetical protein
MNRNWLLPLVLPVMLTVCKSPPKAVEMPPEELPAITIDNVEPVESESPAPESNSIQVTQEMYDQTLAEVKVFIEDLNKIINSKNYNAWKNTLSDEYFAEISSVDFLVRASESPLLKNRIVLKTPNDYFVHVVVPSRASSQVDEIEFIDINRVKAYFLDRTKTETRRLRLCELIKTENEWKIIS